MTWMQDLIEVARKHLQDNPMLLENARQGEPTLLGSILMMVAGVSRNRAEHAVREALERLDRG